MDWMKLSCDSVASICNCQLIISNVYILCNYVRACIHNIIYCTSYCTGPELYVLGVVYCLLIKGHIAVHTCVLCLPVCR